MLPTLYREKCALDGYSIKCQGRFHLHHIISKAWARGNSEVRAYLVTNPPKLTAWICEAHNLSRFADTRDARKILLLQKIEEYGRTVMQEEVDGLPWKVKFESLTLARLIA